MLVTLEGIVTPVRPEHFCNAALLTLVTLEGIVTLPVRPPGHWMSVVWVLFNNFPSKLL